jgi:hypothetical protein
MDRWVYRCPTAPPKLAGDFFRAFFHRASAAFLADSVRSSGPSLAAVAFPPLRPSATAAGFFFFAIYPVILSRCAALRKQMLTCAAVRIMI